MRERRRTILTALAVVAVAAALAVTGYLVFRGDRWDDDSVAAYVDDVAITEEQVDAVVTDLRQAREGDTERLLDRLTDTVPEAELESMREQEVAALDERLALDRERVIEMRILTEAGNRYAAANGIPVPQPATETVAEEAGLEPDNAYVTVVADFFAVMTALQGRVEPVEPQPADQREVYDNLVAEGLTSSTFEEAQEVLTIDTIGEPVAIRNLLLEVVDRAQVRVKPEYELAYQVGVPLGDSSTWLAVPLGG